MVKITSKVGRFSTFNTYIGCSSLFIYIPHEVADGTRLSSCTAALYSEININVSYKYLLTLALVDGDLKLNKVRQDHEESFCLRL